MPLGGTIGWPSNGAVSNLAGTPVRRVDAAPRAARGRFDVVHVHEPVAPVVGWDALTAADAPLVGTFHCYSESCRRTRSPTLLGARRKLNHLRARIAVSEAAAWTGRRFYGGALPRRPQRRRAAAPAACPRRASARPASRCGSSSSARRWSARGCRCCCAPSRRCATQVPAELTIVGLDAGRARAAAGRRRERRARARARRRRREARRAARGRRAVRAFARRRVVRDGADRGVRRRHARRRLRHRRLPRRRDRRRATACSSRARDPTALAEALRDLALDPARTSGWAPSAARSAERYAWPRVAEQVAARLRGGARRARAPRRRAERAAVRLGPRPADGGRAARRAGCPRSSPRAGGSRARAAARRAASAPPVPPAAVGGGRLLALQRIGLDADRVDALVRSQPGLGAGRARR